MATIMVLHQQEPWRRLPEETLVLKVSTRNSEGMEQQPREGIWEEGQPLGISNDSHLDRSQDDNWEGADHRGDNRTEETFRQEAVQRDTRETRSLSNNRTRMTLDNKVSSSLDLPTRLPIEDDRMVWGCEYTDDDQILQNSCLICLKIYGIYLFTQTSTPQSIIDWHKVFTFLLDSTHLSCQ